MRISAHIQKTFVSKACQDAVLYGGAVLGMLAVALYAHVRFSVIAGSPTFFKNAFDEDTYALYPFIPGQIRLDRMLSGGLTEVLAALGGHNPNFTMIAFDALMVPLAFCAALLLTSQLFQAAYARILGAALLVFSADLFSLGSAASYPAWMPGISQFRSVFGMMGDKLVPPIETSYLTILRSPEPQTSYVVGFLFLAVLLRLINTPDASRRLKMALAGAQILLTLSYTFVSTPLLLLEACAATIFIFSSRYEDAVLLFGVFALSVLAEVTAARLLLSGDTAGLTFRSHLPIVTTSVLAGLIAGIWCICALVHRRFRSPILWFAGACALVPVALLNQQIVTGIMISTRDWERYSTWPLIVLGTAILICETPILAKNRPIWSGICLAVVMLVIATATQRSFELWLPTNLESLAASRAIRTDPGAAQQPTYVLTQPDLAPLIRLRLSRPTNFAIDYSNVFLHPVPHRDDGLFVPTPLAASVFSYWSALGWTPETVETVLEREVAEGGGFYSGFLFNICDYWSPCTDDRAVKTKEISAMVPQVVSQYEHHEVLPQRGLLRYLTFDKKIPGGPKISEQPISSGTAGAVTAFVIAAGKSGK